jgi:hypothetical protein
MSNPSAIAAVTSTLRNMLAHIATPLPNETDTDLSDFVVTTMPPDKAGQTDDHNQINLFLYQVSHSSGARNLNGQGLSSGLPGLGLELYFMITAYGRGSSDILAQRLIGRAMSMFHSYPVLSAADIAAALPGSDLENQKDLVRISPHSITNEEMVRLWSNFQVKYRLSVAYRVAVVLLANERAQEEATAVSKVKVTVERSDTGAAT